jgi:hypothetical protein
MNVRVDIEMTPEELRRLMGLPDVEAFNRELMDDIRARMQAGVEGYDPLHLFQSYLSTSMAGMDAFRKFMSAAMSGFKSGEGKDSG